MISHHLKVYKGDVNVSFGGFLHTPERGAIFQASKPYLQDATFFCFKERDSHSSFSRLAAPFHTIVWLINGILLFTVTIIILSTKKLSRKWRHFFIGGRLNRTPILNMWTAVLGYPITKLQNFGIFARTITLLWIILWLLIRSSYQGALYKHLQNPQFTSGFDTIAKIQASDCKIFAPPTVQLTIKRLFNEDR